MPNVTTDVQQDIVYRLPNKATYQEALVKALGDLTAVAATFKKSEDRVFYHPLPLEARQAVARSISWIKELLNSRGELRPEKVEVIRSETGHLLVLKADVISYAALPIPFNERIVDGLEHQKRAKVLNPTTDAALRVRIPAGMTYGEIIAHGRAALAKAGDKRKYALIEDLLERGQTEAGLTVPYQILFDDTTFNDLSLSDVWKGLEKKLAELPEGDLASEPARTQVLAKMDECRRQFARNCWMLGQFAGNNRAAAILDYFGVTESDHLTGFLVRHGNQKGIHMNPEAGMLAFARVLNAAAAGLESPEMASKEYREFVEKAQNGIRLATVPTQIVIGAENPGHLLACLRSKNNQSHGFPPLAFEPEVEQRSLGKQVVSESFMAGMVQALVQGRGDLAEELLQNNPILMERVFCGDEPYSLLKAEADVLSGGECDIVDLDMICIDLLTAIFLPEAEEAKKLVRRVLMEPRNSRFTITNANRRVGALCAMIAGVLGVDPKPRVGEGIWTVDQVKAGVPFAPKCLVDQIKNAETNQDIREALWRQRLVHYAAAARVIEPELGSDEARMGARMSPSKTIRLICQPAAPYPAQATILANKLVTARRDGTWGLELFITAKLSAKGFKDIDAWKADCGLKSTDTSPRRWFMHGFEERSASTDVSKPEELPETPEGQLDKCQDELNKGVKKVQVDLREVVAQINLQVHAECLAELLTQLRSAAQAIANEKGTPIVPIDHGSVQLMREEVEETYAEIRPKIDEVLQKNVECLDEMLDALTDASNVVKPASKSLRTLGGPISTGLFHPGEDQARGEQ